MGHVAETVSVVVVRLCTGMYRSEDVASTFDNLGSCSLSLASVMHVVIGHLLLGFQARRVCNTEMITMSSAKDAKASAAMYFTAL